MAPPVSDVAILRRVDLPAPSRWKWPLNWIMRAKKAEPVIEILGWVPGARAERLLAQLATKQPSYKGVDGQDYPQFEVMPIARFTGVG